MTDFVCSIDIGTSRIKTGLIDRNGSIASYAVAPSPAVFGEICHLDGDAYFKTVCDLIRTALEKIPDANVSSVAITGQRATIVPLGKEGLPIGNALSWQDTRCGETVNKFIDKFGKGNFLRITGLPPSTLWSVFKIIWLRDMYPDLFRSISKFALLTDYILQRLGTEDFITDYSNASVTGLFDLEKLVWSEEILFLAGIDASKLPLLMPAASRVGKMSIPSAKATGLKAGVPLILGGGDQQCAALGCGAVEPGTAGLCLGTAAIITCPVLKPVFDEGGKFFSTAHVVPKRWLMEGIHNSFGSSIRWAKNILNISSPEEFESLVSKAPSGGSGVIFLPFLAGIGSPDFDASVRGAFFGLDLNNSRSDIIRSVLEGNSMEVRRILDTLEPYMPVHKLIITGGQSSTSVIMQIFADITGRNIFLNETSDATLIGSAILGWTGAGEFKNILDGVENFKRKMQQVKSGPIEIEQKYKFYCQLVDLVRQTSRQ